MARCRAVPPARHRLEIAGPRLANPGTPLRIVHLSDLHVERTTRRERALPALVAGLSPDLIVITGDYLNASYADDPRALADLRALLAQLRASGGVYGCLGTAEVDLPELLRPVLAGAGVTLLDDQAAEWLPAATGLAGRYPLHPRPGRRRRPARRSARRGAARRS